MIDANQNQQRVERNRSKGIGGHAVNLAGLAFHGDYGYARRKMAHNAAKLPVE